MQNPIAQQRNDRKEKRGFKYNHGVVIVLPHKRWSLRPPLKIICEFESTPRLWNDGFVSVPFRSIQLRAGIAQLGVKGEQEPDSQKPSVTSWRAKSCLFDVNGRKVGISSGDMSRYC